MIEQIKPNDPIELAKEMDVLRQFEPEHTEETEKHARALQLYMDKSNRNVSEIRAEALKLLAGKISGQTVTGSTLKGC